MIFAILLKRKYPAPLYSIVETSKAPENYDSSLVN